MLKHDSGNKPSLQQMNPELLAIKSKILKFIQEASPSHNRTRLSARHPRSCGNISLHEGKKQIYSYTTHSDLDPKCAKFLRFDVARLSSLMHGYILVTPDVPLVHKLVKVSSDLAIIYCLSNQNRT